MNLRTKLIGGASAVCLAATLGAAPASMALQPAAPGGAIAPASSHQATNQLPVTGELSDGGTFEGTITDLVASNENGVLMLTGTLEGTATDAAGNVTQISDTFTTTFDLTDTGNTTDGTGNRECPILNLDLGPIFLDLLGLQVDLSPVELDITAVPGAGNLLGNLLCSVAGLLDNPGNPLNAITNLLNRLLSGLGLAA